MNNYGLAAPNGSYDIFQQKLRFQVKLEAEKGGVTVSVRNAWHARAAVRVYTEEHH